MHRLNRRGLLLRSSQGSSLIIKVIHTEREWASQLMKILNKSGKKEDVNKKIVRLIAKIKE
jgi:hypothetical protein